MKRMTGGVLVLATMLATGFADLAAQRGPRGPRGPEMGPRRAGVEAIMRMRDQLELTESQLEQLESLRATSVQHRTGQAAMVEELRSRLSAGEIEIEEFREAMESRREANQELAEQHRAQIESILTEDQRDQLSELRRSNRGFEGRGFARGPTRAWQRAGVRGMRDGLGMRAGRGLDRGMRGRYVRPTCRGLGPIGDVGPPAGDFGPA